MNIKIPDACKACPNVYALKLALLTGEIELTKENLLKVIERIETEGHCSGKCADEKGASEDAPAVTSSR